MPTYITLMKFTEQGAKDVKGAPLRIESAIKAWELMGGKVLATYFVMGEYDYVAITECPSDEAAVTASLAVCAREHVKTATLRAFPLAEFARLVEKLP
ncbi:MAG TPA: GYD domain-containing protein [Verrucomicrobiae bacterium]|nr:GYD domain-containing protein [Verrucomicrobiae bacterium]